jgi:predicted phosphodiesterase
MLSGADVARLPAASERLCRAAARADHLVLLGDVLELRERRVADLLDLVRPLFESLGEATAGRRITIVPGNHDHALIAPWLARMRLAGALGRLASYMPATRLGVAYPGLRLRPDVYATHGHYLDLPLTVPRIESVAASAMGRLTGRGSSVRSAADYEAVVGPMYGFLSALGEGASDGALRRSGRVSRNVWERANGAGRAGALLVGRVAIPAAVAALNRLGVGPLRPGITGEDLLHGGLAAMREVADVLAPGAAHLVFGHTHRPGPLPADDASEWLSPGGVRLWNSGSWCHEPAFVGPPAHPGPYWPGTVVELEETGAPRLENVLIGVELPPPDL